MTLTERYIDVVLRRRRLVILLATLLMVAAAAGTSGVGFSGSYRALFGEDNPELIAYDELQATYSSSKAALIAIAPRAGGSVFTRETLAAVEELTEAAWQTPHSVRVNSLTNYFHSEADGDELTVAPLVEDAQSLSAAELARVQAIALDQPELVGQLVSADGRVSALLISFILRGSEEAAWAEITAHLRELLDEARVAHPELAYYLTGNVLLNQAFAEASKDDAKQLIPVAFLTILGIVLVLLRSLCATGAIALLLVFTLSSTVGTAGWLGVLLTPVSAPVPVIIMTVGVAHAIHIVTIMLAGMRSGLARNAAIAQSLSDNLYPVFLTTATTAIGFLSLNTSSAPPFHVLGNLVALGVSFTFLYSITLLPALLAILPLRAPPVGVGRMASAFDRLGDFVVRRRKWLLYCGSLVVLALALGVPRNQLGDNWLHHFDERYAFRTDTDFIIKNLTGLDRLEYSLDSGRAGGITDPDYLRAVEAFADFYRARPEVMHVQAFSDLMKRVNENLHGDDPAFYRIPDDPELAAQFLLLYEFSLPFGADLNDRMDIAKSATRMTVTLRETATPDHLDLDARAYDWLQANAPELVVPASGFTMISAHMSDSNTRSILVGTVLAMALISLILLLVFRNVRIGLLCLAPNFVPPLMAFGLWGHLVGHIGLGASAVAAIAIGIIVDDTIHFLTRYLRARRQGQSSPDAVRATFHAVGPALWSTTLILVAGFLVFASSGYEPSAALGYMVAMTICFAIVADFLLLPPLLMLVDRKQKL